MKNEWYQCCYTNVSRKEGGILSTGWEQVSVSDDIPAKARDNCKQYQGANSSINHAMVDEDGNTLNLLEIVGDGTYLYMIRTKYGLIDAYRRANMFSHAYILPCKDADRIKDPNTFLAIANENFMFSEAESEKTKSRDTLVMNPSFSIEYALKNCELSDKLYLTLLQCIHLQYQADKTVGPLYIECDGSDGQIRELLYLIYSGLPLYIRRRLSIISCPIDNLMEKDIVFCKNAENQKRYLIPKTGENNILVESTKGKAAKLEYMSHAVAICHQKDMGDYYKSLDGMARDLGDVLGSQESVLQIAYKLYMEQPFDAMTEKELTGLLRSALRSDVKSSGKMTEVIVCLLKELDKKGYQLSDPMKKKLFDFADRNKNEADLQKIVNQYRLKDMGVEDEDKYNEDAVSDQESELYEADGKMEWAIMINILHGMKVVYTECTNVGEEFYRSLDSIYVEEITQAVKDIIMKVPKASFDEQVPQKEYAENQFMEDSEGCGEKMWKEEKSVILEPEWKGEKKRSFFEITNGLIKKLIKKF